MKLTFRKAEQRDLFDIEQCVEQAYRPYVAVLGVEPAPLSTNYEDHICKGNVLIAHASNGDFVGILLSYVDGESLIVDNVAITPAFQRRGALVEICVHAVQLARAAGLTNIRTFTNQKLVRNINMYKKLGLLVDHIEQMSDRTAVHMKFSLDSLQGKTPDLAKRIMRGRA